MEYHGEWFLPKYPHIRLSGILLAEEDKFELTLYSATDFLGNPFINDDNKVNSYSIILGICHDNKVTLVSSDWRKSDRISNSLDTFTVSPHFVLDGAHFQGINEINLKRISCNYSFLSAWMDGQEFYHFFDHENESLESWKQRITKKVTVDINESLSIDILRIVITNEFSERNSIKFSVRHFVEFRSTGSLTLNEFERHAFILKKLIEFSINEPVHVTYDYAISSNPNDRVIAIFQRRKERSQKKDSSDYRNSSFMLFNAKALGESRFQYIVKNWFDSMESHGVIYDMYLDTQQWFLGSGIFLSSVVFNNRFLNIIQSLESFHYIEHQTEEESKEKFKSDFGIILGKLDESKDKEWLRKRTHKFSKNLEHRLYELICTFDFLFADILVSKQDKLAFAQELRKIRNALSHGSHKKTDNADDFRDKYNLSRMLLIACILFKIGFAKDEIREIFNQSFQYSSELHYLRTKSKQKKDDLGVG
jgi:hypothetical protein